MISVFCTKTTLRDRRDHWRDCQPSQIVNPVIETVTSQTRMLTRSVTQVTNWLNHASRRWSRLPLRGREASSVNLADTDPTWLDTIAPDPDEDLFT